MVAMCTWFNPDNPNLSRSREDGIGGWADLQISGIKDFPSWFDKLTTTVTQFNIILTGGDDCLHRYPLLLDSDALYY